MTAATPTSAPGSAGSPARPWSVFLPREHGSWSLVAEPLLLALLVAPSAAGGAVALAALTGLFLRRPLRTLLEPAGRARAARARLALVIFGGVAASACAFAATLAGIAALAPLLLAAPFALLFAWFDAQGEARAFWAELAGAAAYGVLPVGLAKLGGWSHPTALVLGLVALGRSVPTVLTVRACLRHARGEPVNRTWPLLASAFPVALLAGLSFLRLAPVGCMVPVALLFVRAAWLLSDAAPHWPARRLGLLEAGLGLAGLAVNAAAFLAGQAGG